MRMHHDPRSAYVTVEFEPADVAQFASRWPCFDGPEDGVAFTFQVSNGDLVDMEPADWDGGAALAMSEDAWSYFLVQSAPEASWNRFDICEAWSVLAHDFGLYGLAERLRRMGFRPSRSLSRESLSPNAAHIYTLGESKARQTGRWARRIGGEA